MEGFAVAWWIWMLGGILLLLAEFLTPGAFYQFFFGLGAMAVGLLGALGLELSLPVQLGLFLALSIGSLALLRKPLRMRFAGGPEEPVDELVGETAVALEEIAAGATGQVELRGSVWQARNVGDAPIGKSARCRVTAIHGLTLDVRA